MAILRSTKNMSLRLALVLCLTAFTGLLLVAWKGNPTRADRHANAATTGYWYYYFKEKYPLSLDASRVAVLQVRDAGGPGATPDLSPYGLDVATVEPMAVNGWSFVNTRSSVRTDVAIRTTVSEIASEELVDFVSPVLADRTGDFVVITPQILVGFDRNLPPARAEAILAKSGAGEIVERDWANMERTYRLKSASRDGFEVLEAANRLAELPEVMFAEPDKLTTAHLELTPNDPYFSPILWALHNDGTLPIFCGALPDFDMDAPEAWDITTGDPSIIVAILDSGTQLDHPDLNLYTPGFDPTGGGGGGGPVNACDNHGTWVAGCVSAIINNGIGVVGIAPNVRSAPVRVIASNVPCDGGGVIAESWVVAGLAWAELIGARITNSSWYRNFPSAAITQKYADTRANGIVHFGAAGNSALNTLTYPASLPSVNAVAALDPCGNRAVFSNYGVGLDFSAPGYVASTDRTGTDGGNDGINDGVCLPAATQNCNSDPDCGPGSTCLLVSVDYALVVGTSFASPYAAGVAALALSVRPDLTADQVEVVLQQSSVDLGSAGYDTDYGWGFVNAANAVGSAVLVGVEDTPPFRPADFTLHGGRPNPFDGRTSIEYDLLHRSTVQLRIIDVSGRVVRATPVHSESSGPHAFLWDGTDANGSKMAAGVYFFDLRVNGMSQTRKGILLH